MESAKCGGTVDAAGRQDTETEPDMKAIAVETGAERSAGTPYSGGKKTLYFVLTLEATALILVDGMIHYHSGLPQVSVGKSIFVPVTGLKKGYV